MVDAWDAKQQIAVNGKTWNNYNAAFASGIRKDVPKLNDESFLQSFEEVPFLLGARRRTIEWRRFFQVLPQMMGRNRRM